MYVDTNSYFIGLAISVVLFVVFILYFILADRLSNKDLVEQEFIECPTMLSCLSEDTRISYEQAKVFQQRYPFGSISTDITPSQYKSIREKGISAFEFEWNMETQSFVSARTEIQFFSGENCVQTNLPLPKNQDVYYWEAKMFEKPVTTTVSIGVATKPYPYWRLPGWNKHSIGYFSHTGNKHFSNPFFGSPYSKGFEEGDVVGVGYYHHTGTIFFTKNGKRLQTACFGLEYNLFPTIGANGPCQIHVNLGQRGFVFVEANSKRWGIAPAEGTLSPPPAYGHEMGSMLLARGGNTRDLIATSSADFEDDDNTPLIQYIQRSYSTIPIPINRPKDLSNSLPSYSTFPSSYYKGDRRVGLV